jgi:hypothetical protein
MGAIMAFLGRNPDDVEDNDFAFKTSNEIYAEETPSFADLDGRTHQQIKQLAGDGNVNANVFIKDFHAYDLTIVQLSGSRLPEEFNLQFTRLNLGTIINSGEKLHAMVGDIRDVCFGDLGQHPFLDGVRIPTRRYSKEQVLAQILAQVFSLQRKEGYARTRHFDLQRFFKDYATLGPLQKGWIKEAKTALDALAKAFENPSIFRNRAITVSVVILAWKLGMTNPSVAKRYASFIEEFLCRLNWQLDKDLEYDPEYRYLLDFQRHVTQASVEKPAVEARAIALEAEYESWTSKHAFTGDQKYYKRTGGKPGVECRGKP